MDTTVPSAVVVTHPGLSRHYWAINRDVEQEGRHVCQTNSIGNFAIIRLRLEIDFGDAAVLFVNSVDEQTVPVPHRERLGAYIDEMVEGIREVLPALSPDSLQIRALKITLLEVRTHPLDTRLRDFRLAAIDAMTKAVRTVGLSPGPL